MLHNPNVGKLTQEQEVEYWMLVGQDENVRTLRKLGMSKPTAEMELRAFREANERKPHKQEYFIFPYTASTLEEVLKREYVTERYV